MSKSRLLLAFRLCTKLVNRPNAVDIERVPPNESARVAEGRKKHPAGSRPGGRGGCGQLRFVNINRNEGDMSTFGLSLA